MSADRFGSAKKKEEDLVSDEDEEEKENNENINDGADFGMQDSGDPFEMKEKVEFEIFVCNDEEWET